jgi:hypothetical protein
LRLNHLPHPFSVETLVTLEQRIKCFLDRAFTIERGQVQNAYVFPVRAFARHRVRLVATTVNDFAARPIFEAAERTLDKLL